MTLVHTALAQATGMRRRSNRSERQRKEVSGKREQQQKSCEQSLHESFVKQNPE